MDGQCAGTDIPELCIQLGCLNRYSWYSIQTYPYDGADFFLFLGMGTEVIVFFLSAFDRPFDKTADGMDLDTHVRTGEDVVQPASVPGVSGGNGGGGNATVIGGNGGTIIIGGGAESGRNAGAVGQTKVDSEAIAAVSSSVNTMAGGAQVTTVFPPVNPELEEATTNYVDELKRLTEMLSKVSAQSERLAHDSEEMENLNRTLTGICKVYEMQLKSASSQIGTIDDINEQTKKMAGQIAELNSIYARMIEAMSARVAPVGQ